MPNIRVEVGKKVRGWGGSWYRHDRVLVDGVPLSGFVQVRYRAKRGRLPGRIEVATCYGDAAVIGSNLPWLLAENGRNYETQVFAK